jgi:hypothetical protein
VSLDGTAVTCERSVGAPSHAATSVSSISRPLEYEHLSATLFFMTRNSSRCVSLMTALSGFSFMNSLIEDVTDTHEESLDAERWYRANPTLTAETARAATAMSNDEGRFGEATGPVFWVFFASGRARREVAAGSVFRDRLACCAAIASFSAATIGSTSSVFLAAVFLAAVFFATVRLATGVGLCFLAAAFFAAGAEDACFFAAAFLAGS